MTRDVYKLKIVYKDGHSKWHPTNLGADISEARERAEDIYSKHVSIISRPLRSVILYRNNVYVLTYDGVWRS